jgi:hypothetical protein
MSEMLIWVRSSEKRTAMSARASRAESNCIGVGAAETTAWETKAARIAKDVVNFMVIE